MRTLALVDGEHYPSVTRAALEAAGERGHEIVAALLVGGTEKLPAGDDPPDLGVPVLVVAEERMRALRAAIAELTPDVVLDLSDEPVLGYRERMELVSMALARAFRTSVPTSGSIHPSRARRSACRRSR